MIDSYFTNEDFRVFTIDGLTARMDALKSTLQPKLEWLGKQCSPTLSTLTGDEMFYHVAKHARRTKNPPADTWVAFSSNNRGYKMLPHFQIGLWESHLFITYALIYEAHGKVEIGKKLKQRLSEIVQLIPSHFVWSGDHTKPEATAMSEITEDDLLALFRRLQTVKRAEIICGRHIPRSKAVQMTRDELLEEINNVFIQLIPLYRMQ